MKIFIYPSSKISVEIHAEQFFYLKWHMYDGSSMKANKATYLGSALKLLFFSQF